MLESLFKRLWKRDERLMRAQDKRLLIDNQRREELQYEAIKWDVERIQREQAKDIFVTIFWRQKRVRIILSIIRQR